MQDQIKDIDRLSDMKDFSKLVLVYLPAIDEKEFAQNDLARFGLLKMMENIGEDAYQISRATKSEFTHIEWDKIIGARHVYVHDYYKIDWAKIWTSLNTIEFEAIINETDNLIGVLKNRFSID